MKHSAESRFAKRILLAYRRYVVRGQASQQYESLFGASPDDIRRFIELQFDDGMSWRTYGDWDIDHIVPLALFDFTSHLETSLCFHFLNTRPLHVLRNRHKGADVHEARAEIAHRLEVWPHSAELLGLRDILERAERPAVANRYFKVAESWSIPEFAPRRWYRHTIRGIQIA